jgi:predicted  nucleic acid-binding Zn-ribbon protein
MSDILVLAEKANAAAEQLSERYEQLKIERSILNKQLSGLSEEIARQQGVISKLEQEIIVMQSARTSVPNGNSAADYSEISGRIGELVKEIDRCIALLNR